MTDTTELSIADQQREALIHTFGDTYARRFDEPVLFRTVTLHNQVVKQFLKRDFPLVSRTIFVETVYRRRWMFNQAILDSFAEVSCRRADEIMRALTQDFQRIKALCDANGRLEDVTYVQPSVQMVPIIANGARLYMDMLTQLDANYSLIGTATLNGVLDTKQRRDAELKCRKLVRAYAAMIRNEVFKLFRESDRLRIGATQPDEELDAAEAAQREAAHASVEAAKQDNEVIEDSTAEGVIADIVSATNATSAKGSRRSSKAANTTAVAADGVEGSSQASLVEATTG